MFPFWEQWNDNRNQFYKNYKVDKKPYTHEQIANEVGVSPATVTNAEKQKYENHTFVSDTANHFIFFIK